MAQFQVGQEVALLGLVLFLLGYALHFEGSLSRKMLTLGRNGFGPLLFAPVSEAFGRKVSVLAPMFAAMIFAFASATAKDLQTLLITRFFAGVFASAPLSNVGGVLADIWPAEQRGAALLTYGIAVITGPLIAPIVGGALVLNLEETGWRWTEYVCVPKPAGSNKVLLTPLA